MNGMDGTAFAELTGKVEELGRICARLSLENAELRGQVSRLQATPAQVRALQGVPAGAAEGQRRAAPPAAGAAAPERRVSRRTLGKALGAAAAGMVGAAALAEPAAAANGNNITAGNVTTAETGTTVQYDGSSALQGVIFLANDTTFANSDTGFPAALGGWGGPDTPNGVFGFTQDHNGHGVIGHNSNAVATGAGVFGRTDSTAANAAAVIGTVTSTSPGAFSAAVRGQNSGTGGNGVGVWGSHNGTGWGVYGTVTGAGIAVLGQGLGKGTGVRGDSTQGRGGVFSGIVAQVQLIPGSGPTHPNSGKRGDLYADSTGRLWFCKTSGTHATWHQIA